MIRSTWRSPSNIALVKYWGKKGIQLPANPSLSFSLDSCYTETSVSIDDKSEEAPYQIEVYVDGEPREAFIPKIAQFFDKVKDQFPWISEYSIKVETHNTFPHSSGIASSASAFSALAQCLCTIDQQLNSQKKWEQNEVSSIARLGSGSACRSVAGGLMMWGKHNDYPGSNDEYAVSHTDIHPVFNDYQDVILLVHKGEKSVSSTVGHGLLKGHPFAEARFEQAVQNMSRLKSVLASGDLDAFVELVESEALTLHAMMLSSSPSFILMKENTLSIINAIRDFREQYKVPVCFTLDAGANVHMLFPKTEKDRVMAWVDEKLKTFCENDAYICDQVGKGPVEITSKHA